MPRIMSVTMTEPEVYNQGMLSAPPQYTYQQQPTTPMYAEDQLPMSVQIPMGRSPVPENWTVGKRGRGVEGEEHGEVTQ
jgi:hypothetical protein